MGDTKKQKMARAAWTLAFCFAAGAVLSSLLLAWARVSGSSMAPGLMDGDLCTGVRQFEPSYGDIVLIDDSGRDRVIVKRVIGLPGDVIIIMADGSASRNGTPLDEPYAFLDMAADPGSSTEYTVPDGCVFVLGDNRGNSEDSRSARVGAVPMERLIGRLDVRVWPVGRAGRLGDG